MAVLRGVLWLLFGAAGMWLGMWALLILNSYVPVVLLFVVAVVALGLIEERRQQRSRRESGIRSGTSRPSSGWSAWRSYERSSSTASAFLANDGSSKRSGSRRTSRAHGRSRVTSSTDGVDDVRAGPHLWGEGGGRQAAT